MQCNGRLKRNNVLKCRICCVPVSRLSPEFLHFFRQAKEQNNASSINIYVPLQVRVVQIQSKGQTDIDTNTLLVPCALHATVCHTACDLLDKRIQSEALWDVFCHIPKVTHHSRWGATMRGNREINYTQLVHVYIW